MSDQSPKADLILQSQYFLPLRKEDPKDEQFANAKLLVRAGYIEKLHAGVYSFLPLGLRVLERIKTIIREEMNAIGGQELMLPALHPKEPWQQTGRFTTYDPPLFIVSDSREHEYMLAPTHEEVVVPIAKLAVRSYRDLPIALYQFQTKFRNELRPKSGLLRGREFIMKDLYSFHTDEKDFEDYYGKVKEAYRKVFERTGLGEQTFLTFASGGSFSEYSHEYQTLTDAGEDTIFLCQQCRVAVNKEIIEKHPQCPQCGGKREILKEHRAIEVGNIFPLKTRFSEAFDLRYRDQEGKEQAVIMGCYGIGVGRLMGAIIEIHHDARGIVWPNCAVAPFDVHVLGVGRRDGVFVEALNVAQSLQKSGISVLYDDRTDVSAGEKFASADLVGIPWRVVVSERTQKEGKLEAQARPGTAAQMVTLSEFQKMLAAKAPEK